MAHDKIVGFCEPNKCKVEVSPKTVVDDHESRLDSLENVVSGGGVNSSNINNSGVITSNGGFAGGALHYYVPTLIAASSTRPKFPNGAFTNNSKTASRTWSGSNDGASTYTLTMSLSNLCDFNEYLSTNKYYDGAIVYCSNGEYRTNVSSVPITLKMIGDPTNGTSGSYYSGIYSLTGTVNLYNGDTLFHSFEFITPKASGHTDRVAYGSICTSVNYSSTVPIDDLIVNNNLKAVITGNINGFNSQSYHKYSISATFTVGDKPLYSYIDAVYTDITD